MTETIDRKRVKAAFHRQAEDYDSHALVQKRVVGHVLKEVQREAGEPQLVLDVGAGTGRLLAGLHRIYPKLRAVGADLAFGMCLTARANFKDCGRVQLVTADAESLPFADGVFDLVTSTSTYQWLTSLELAFKEAWRVLAPGGLFCFALFGQRTLFELKDSYRLALNNASQQGEDRTHRFFAATDVAAALECAGFSHCRADAELELEYHADVSALLRSLKRIGAGNAAPVAPRGLAGRRVMLEMMDVYRSKYANADGIPATYEVVYGAGRKQHKEVSALIC
ncbi:methyltransferase domain-containing protein [Geotalea uraniireducens]|uniref:Malonyl-[acyl-carrier protein] O-methyltransferase n=1 Tax=Geotalea uraniireducens (strain Rf4) TaxID=351605 RepID=A5G6I7_GEOUR|nr:methyltransferase domain-containing protein [Geotalea uraniireducens]ABQ27405.1 Methyltransferase type 11 [Geotalea uraniireducens Rf4]